MADYLLQCRLALQDIRAYGLAHRDLDPEQMAEAYNATSGLPTVAPRIFKAALEWDG